MTLVRPLLYDTVLSIVVQNGGAIFGFKGITNTTSSTFSGNVAVSTLTHIIGGTMLGRLIT